jgi:NADH-quinone oxidoreductase subunit N
LTRAACEWFDDAVNDHGLLYLLQPEIVIVAGAFLVLLIDVLRLRNLPVQTRATVGAWLTVAFCLSALGLTVALMRMDQRFATGEGGIGLLGGAPGVWVVDGLVLAVKAGVLVLTVFTALVSCGSRFTSHVGEFFCLLLLATAGLMALVSTENLLMIFVSLELLSLSLYAMTAFHDANVSSAEAALKYFLIGGVSAAFLLFGLSLVYGLTHQLDLAGIAKALSGSRPDPLLMLAVLMVMTGFGFKVAAVPFHLWAPDAYQGAPIPAAALIASGSKLASFFLLAKVVLLGLAHAGAWRNFAAGWMPVVAVLAACSMVVGNLAAIAQKNVRRLLAYSAVAHSGYALLALLAARERAVESLLYYVFTYALTVVGAFAVVALVQQQTGEEDFPAFAGLGRRAPVLGFCMMIFLLSLAGIPPLAGFFGKFYVFTAAATGTSPGLGLLWLVILAIAMSAVSLYYYLQVLKQIYVVPAPAGSGRLGGPWPSQLAVALLALGVVVLGCAPAMVLNRLSPLLKHFAASLP